ncbi:hypothetical protein BDZ89DRAFT_385915 [Hymenopellis radicata]|nr:hypothetical protein BDZ89DRAFT_385915 [Hymenopellis radicata]
MDKLTSEDDNLGFSDPNRGDPFRMHSVSVPRRPSSAIPTHRYARFPYLAYAIMPPVTPTRRTRPTPYSRSPSSSQPKTRIFERLDLVQFAFDAVQKYLAESIDHRKSLLTETDFALLLDALHGIQTLTAHSHLQRWMKTASVRQGSIYIERARRLVCMKDLDSALASLRFSEQPADMLDEAQRRFAGIPDELVRCWHQELVELAKMQKIWYGLKEQENFVPIPDPPQLEPSSLWSPSASTVVASDSDNESDLEEDEYDGGDADDDDDDDEEDSVGEDDTTFSTNAASNEGSATEDVDEEDGHRSVDSISAARTYGCTVQ